MLVTLATLGRVFTRPRQIGVVVATAIIYAMASVLLPNFELIPGLPGFRPTVALVVALAVLGGAPAAWGACLGGLVIGLAGAGPAGRGVVPALGEGAVGLLVGIIAWKTGWMVRQRYDPEIQVPRALRDVVWDCGVLAVLCGLVYATFLAWLSEVVGARAFAYEAIVLSANACVSLVVLVPVLVILLQPVARGAGAMWVDPRGDAATSGAARVARAAMWAGVVVCLGFGLISYAPEAHGLAHLADPSLVKGALVWAVQAPVVVLVWLGALFG